mgnify:CR=1 FL=1
MQNLNDRLNRSLSPSNIRDLIRVTTNAGRPSNTVSIFKFSRDVEEGVARASALQRGRKISRGKDKVSYYWYIQGVAAAG